MSTSVQIADVWQAGGCTDYRAFENGRDAMVMPLLFTYAIIADLTPAYYGDRWCYHSYAAAKVALDTWDGEGEPTGWHRHPDSGRRRENGDPVRETINW